MNFFNHLWEIEIKNFCSIEQLKLDTRQQKLTHIIGINNDDELSPSNGSGKSTIKSAVCWCLFGMTETGRQADSVLPWWNPKGCYVKTTWSNGTSYIDIVRYRADKDKKNALELYLNGEDITGKDNDDTQNLINNYLGFNYDLFCLLLTTGMTSKKMKDFMIMTDREKKEFVGFLLDLSFLDVAQEKAKASYKEANEKIKAEQDSLIAVSAKIEATDASIAENEKRVLIFNAQIAESIEQKKNEIAGREEELPAKRKILEDLRDQVKAIIIPPSPDTTEIDKKKKQIIEYRNHNDEQLKAKTAKNKELLQLTESLGREVVVDETEPSIMKAKSELASAERELTVTESIVTDSYTDKQVDKFNKQIAEAVGFIDAMQHKLEEVNARVVDEVCPTCGQNLNAEHVDKIKVANICEFNNLKDDIKNKQEIVSKLQAESEAYCSQKLSELKKKTADKVSDLKAEISQLRGLYEEAKKAEYERLVKERNVESIKAQISKVHSEISTIDAIYATNTKNISKLDAELVLMESDIKQVQDAILAATNQKASLKSKFAALKAEYETLKSRLDMTKTALQKLEQDKANNPYQKFVDSSKQTLLTHTNEKATIEAAIQKLETDRKYIEFWIEGFGDKGVKSYILDSITELLEQKANFALSHITNGNVSIGFCTQKKNKSNDTVKDEFTVEIYRDGQMVQFIDLSKGERCRVTFAVNYALKALGTYYHGLNLNFEWYDEVLDGLDEIGCYQVIQFLRKELATYESIFVVSHNPNVNSLFDHSLIIEKTEGKSVLRSA